MTEEIENKEAEAADASPEAATEAVSTPTKGAEETEEEATQSKISPIVSSTKKKRPPYKYDPNKITLRFLFANRDGLAVTIECDPTDTVGEVKGALISVWPKDLASCDAGERVRLVCMGKGFLTPDSRTLADCEVPVFTTHATPINVSVKPQPNTVSSSLSKRSDPTAAAVSQGCGCILQ